MNDTTQPAWAGWYFEDGFLCSPNGDRFSELCVLACLFARQMSTFREATRTREPDDRLH